MATDKARNLPSHSPCIFCKIIGREEPCIQLYEDDGLFGPEKIFKNADNLKVELFHLIAGKNCVRVSLHACPYLAEGKNFVRFLGEGDARPRAKCRRERQEREEQQARRLG